MLSKNLDLTYLMVWTIVLANVVGGVMAFMLSNQLAKVVKVRAAILVPLVMAIVFVGVLQSSRQWEDIYFLLGVGMIGWIMKRARWSRAPLILAFVLMPLVENYYYIATRIHGWEWAVRPIPLVVLSLTALGLIVMLAFRARRNLRSMDQGQWVFKPSLRTSTWLPVVFIVVCVLAFWSTLGWPQRAAIVPQIILILGGVTAFVAILGEWFRIERTATGTSDEGMHYDIETDFGDMPLRRIWIRALVYIAWLIGFLLLARTIGIIPAIGPFVLAYIWVQRERWFVAGTIAGVFWLVAWVLFEHFLRLAWPTPWVNLAALF